MARLQSDEVSVGDVTRSLQVLLAAFSVVEAHLGTLDWYRPQAPAIASDLRRLGVPSSSIEVAASPLDDACAQLGAAYVLIGSRLGVQSIRRHLAARLGEEFVERSAYYTAEAEHASAQWIRLREALSVAEPSSHSTICAAAGSTFALFKSLAEQADFLVEDAVENRQMR